MSDTTVFRAVFHGLEQNTLEQLKAVGVRRTYPAGTVLCRQGAREHTFYIILDGRVSVTQMLEDGQERLIGVRRRNEYFGELGLIDDQPRAGTVQTLKATTVLEIDEVIFDKLVENSPAVAYAITRRTIDTLRDNDRRAIESLMAKNAALKQAYEELQTAQVALVEKERLEHELTIAATVQRGLLPQSLPRYADYQFSAYLEPARAVGGDFYDVIELDDEHVGLLMADVADKGVHASLGMAVTRTLFHLQCRASLSPAGVATGVHEAMLSLGETEMFLTAFYGVLHRPTGKLTYVLAGQDRPLLVRGDGCVEVLTGRGRFLGMIGGLQLPEYSIQLRASDRLIMFSDGVPDAENCDGEPYGNAKLSALLSAHAHQSANQLVQTIIQEITNWCVGAETVDDLTLLAVAVT